MVRRRVVIKAIKEVSKRNVAFSKRRSGLINKTKGLCDTSEVEAAAVIVFSKSGNLFGFGHPNINQVIDRYLANSDVEESLRGDERGCALEEAAPPLTEAEMRVREMMADGHPAWDAMVMDLELSQLVELEEAMEKIKSTVAERERAVAATTTCLNMKN